MNKYLLLTFLFVLVSCKATSIKVDDKSNPIKNKVVSPKKRQVSVNQINSSIKNFPYIYRRTLYFWKTPQEDQKQYRKLLKILNGYSSTYHLMNKSEKRKVVSPYVGSLLKAIKKRNPEVDANKLIAKKQRFMLAYDNGKGGGLLPSRDYSVALYKGVSSKARIKCASYFSPPSSLKTVQGDNEAVHLCHNNPVCDQFSDVLATYIFRWNRAILKSCEKKY